VLPLVLLVPPVLLQVLLALHPKLRLVLPLLLAVHLPAKPLPLLPLPVLPLPVPPPLAVLLVPPHLKPPLPDALKHLFIYK
jgi:hypothetical protein